MNLYSCNMQKQPQKYRLQATFSWNEDFIIGSDEQGTCAVVFNSRTGEMVFCAILHLSNARRSRDSLATPILFGGLPVRQ